MFIMSNVLHDVLPLSVQSVDQSMSWKMNKPVQYSYSTMCSAPGLRFRVRGGILA